jgi:hypothetical protein
MSSSAGERTARAVDVHVSDSELVVTLNDGRRIGVPLAWYPRLCEATPEQRAHWELLGDGEGIQELSVAGLLGGQRAPDA